MSTKVINLSYATRGTTSCMSFNPSTKKWTTKILGDIPSQMKDILEGNPEYEFKHLVYHETKASNVIKASLIVQVEK